MCIRDRVKGVYVPFWLYDGSAEVDVRCHGTKVSGYSTAQDVYKRQAPWC